MIRKTGLMTLALCGFFYAQVLSADGLGVRQFPDTLPEGIQNGKQQYAEGEVLVQFDRAVPYSSQRRALARSGAASVRQLGASGLYHVKAQDGAGTRDLIMKYKSDPQVLSVQPNYLYHAMSAPSDPLYSQQWGFKNSGQSVSCPAYVRIDGAAVNNPGTAGCDINIESAWNYITDCSSVTVAVIDAGVNYLQEDLASNMWSAAGYSLGGYDCISGTADPMDYNGHGTMVAGIIGAANNSTGGVGVCWKTRIMAVKALDSTGTGTTSSIVNGIKFAVDHGAKVIALCLSGSSYDAAMYAALVSAKNAGVLVVTGSGNDGADIDNAATSSNPEWDAYPAEYALDNIISVAALDQNFSLASFSNYGELKTTIAAPGVNVYNAWAGMLTTIKEDFVSDDYTTPDWNGIEESSTLYSSSNWGVRYYNDTDYPGIRHYYLSNPSSTGSYRNSSSDKAWKDFNTFGKFADSVTIGCTLYYLLADSGDSFGLYFNNANRTPTVANSIALKVFTGDGAAHVEPFLQDITAYTKGYSYENLMFQMITNSSGGNTTGARVFDLVLKALSLNANSYRCDNGTSLAAAHVAGAAAMLLAFNPEYGYADVANALSGGSRSVPGLAGKVKNGNALDAMGSLEYLDTPTQVQVVQQ